MTDTSALSEFIYVTEQVLRTPTIGPLERQFLDVDQNQVRYCPWR
jgi:hypothetical protein